MKFKATLLIAAFALTPAVVVKADRGPFGTGELPEILKPFDVDKDGKLNAEERAAYKKALKAGLVDRPRHDHPRGDGKLPAHLEQYDLDKDGKLSEAEIKAAHEAIKLKIEEERAARFKELDKDGNGELTKEEMSAIPNIKPEMVDRIIKRLDKDANGTVSLDEFLAGIKRGGGLEGGSVSASRSVHLRRTVAALLRSEAEVKIKFNATGATSLEVEVEDAAVGAYAVQIDGADHGSVTVVRSDGGTKGKLKFETGTVTAPTLALDFAAAGKAITISFGGVVHYTGTIPAAPVPPTPPTPPTGG